MTFQLFPEESLNLNIASAGPSVPSVTSVPSVLDGLTWHPTFPTPTGLIKITHSAMLNDKVAIAIAKNLLTPAADAILLKSILHDWSDDECVKILNQCKEAITKKGKKAGKVIIIDMLIENKNRDKESTETQLFFDLLMMVLATRKERNEKEWAKFFSDAGFSHYKITRSLSLRSVIEVYS